MKPLPKEINKTKMVELYCDQYSSKTVKEEIRSIQETLGISIYKKILCNRTKFFFFKIYGLPTGYEITEENNLVDYSKLSDFIKNKFEF